MARADALLVNLGTFDAERRDATAAALEVAAERRVPWVLDPVFIDRSEPRAAYAKSLVAQKPDAIRLNRAEFRGAQRRGAGRRRARRAMRSTRWR